MCPNIHLDSPRDLFKKESVQMKTLYGDYAAKIKMKAFVIRSQEAFFRKLSRRAGLKQSLTSFMNSPMVHLLRYQLFFEALAKLSAKVGTQTRLNFSHFYQYVCQKFQSVLPLVSLVMCHLSHVTCHMSCVTCHKYFIFTKW